MLRKVSTATVIALLSTPTFAADARFEATLKQLDPDTRLEQLCAAEAMDRIGRESNPFQPERAVPDAISPTHVVDHTLQGTGAAFRSKGRWYQLSFTCKASPDHMKIISFEYQIGPAIPEAKWASYGLWH